MLKTATSLFSAIFRLNWLELLGWAHNVEAQTMEIPIATTKSGIENSATTSLLCLYLMFGCIF